MRALSLGLIKGRIDEVNQTVCITWLKPRVLDREQVRGRLQFSTYFSCTTPSVCSILFHTDELVVVFPVSCPEVLIEWTKHLAPPKSSKARVLDSSVT